MRSNTKTGALLALIILLCVLVAGCLCIAGCGKQPEKASKISAGGQSSEKQSATFVATTAAVPPGSTFEFSYQGQKAILINFKGQYRAYANHCNHAGGPCALKEDKTVCKWHGAQFDPMTGKLLRGPPPV